MGSGNNEHYIQITSGQGPLECSWVVGQVVKVMKTEADQRGFQIQTVTTVEDAASNTYKSYLYSVKQHEGVNEWLSSWLGTIQWIGSSAYRPKHKRKNRFVGVNKIEMPEQKDIDMSELKYETYRASGPGGQHVNKTESAVRVTHIPTGITATAQENRSQHENRKLALARLMMTLEQEQHKQVKKAQKSQWSGHHLLERGNPVRVYRGPRFERVINN